MNTYWDHTESERALLDREQVIALLRLELMEKGVVHPVPPKLLPVEDVEVSTQEVYQVLSGTGYSSTLENCVFRTLKEAEAFTALNPMKIERDWDTPNKYGYAAALADLSIKKIEVCTQQDVISVKSRLKEAKENKAANDKAQSEYSKALEAVTQATSDIWDDYHERIEEMAKCESVRKTWEEYRELAGDDAKAAIFLTKAHSDEDINRANEWLSLGIPAVEVPADGGDE
jgi:hypothetical protein